MTEASPTVAKACKARQEPIRSAKNIPTMIKSLLLALAATAIDASTNVAVLEFGNQGTVRATNTEDRGTTVEGVASFWNALSDRSTKQHSGMSVIPDMFRTPDSNLVIGISDVDVESLEAFMDDIVGVLEIPGKKVNSLLAKVPEIEDASIDSFHEKCENFDMKQEMKALRLIFGEQSDANVHTSLAPGLRKLKEAAVASGRTLVVHLVVENDQVTRPAARRLEEAAEEEAVNGYYGYGYYKNGEWVTPYKTIFQIQYFNVVTWTAIGLAFAMIYTFYLMVFMPLEPDTLLFGESAKMVGEN